MLYVAYGSNMNLNQMKFRCPNSKRVGVGKLNGWKLVFNVHADIIKTDNNKSSIPVVVWDIAKEDWHRLDMYEGYPNYYVKENVEVKLGNGAIVTAIAYVMNERRKGICPPPTSYFNGIKQGCVDNRIDIQYLYDALQYSCENETEYNQYNVKEG